MTTEQEAAARTASTAAEPPFRPEHKTAQAPQPMTNLFLIQLLNGVQFGILLFLVAAGLTLVFGIMDFINLAHGVQYMIGAYLMASFAAMTGSFFWGLALTLPATLLIGIAL